MGVPAADALVRLDHPRAIGKRRQCLGWPAWHHSEARGGQSFQGELFAGGDRLRAARANLGRRHDYHPLSSPLCEHGEVLPLVEQLITRFGFTRLYLADLDAVQRQGDRFPLLEAIAERYPKLGLWIDAGFTGPTAVAVPGERLSFRPVIGTESWLSGDTLPGEDPILSIDSDWSGLRDPSGIAADAARRPRDL